MPGLVPGISLRRAWCVPKRDGRDTPGHDGCEVRSYKLIAISSFMISFVPA